MSSISSTCKSIRNNSLKEYTKSDAVLVAVGRLLEEEMAAPLTICLVKTKGYGAINQIQTLKNSKYIVIIVKNRPSHAVGLTNLF